MPYSVLLSNKNWGEGFLEVVVIATRLAEYQSTCGMWWVIAFALPVGCLRPFFLPFTYSTVFILTHELFLIFAFPILSRNKQQGAVNEWLVRA